MYIVRASSYEYKDGVVSYFLVFRDDLMSEDSAYPCLYRIYTKFYCQDAESEEVT